MIRLLHNVARNGGHKGNTALSSSCKKYLNIQGGSLSSLLSGHQRQIETAAAEGQRQKLVILGTGWASYSVLKNIDKKKYDAIVVSPRNHFLFTPLLCSTTVGTLEFRSIIEPVRNTKFRQSTHYHLSEAYDLDLQGKTLKCRSVLNPDLEYDLAYDKLVIGVGSLSNTFGVPGVKEHAFFLKEISDARAIRNRLLQNYEQVVQPGITEEELDRLLHVVIVGGGPTGVEFGAELYDFARQDLSRLYSKETAHGQVSLIESNQILSSFDDRLRRFAETKIKQRERFNIIQDSVVDVKKDSVTLKSGKVIPCGLVVWSTGLAPRPFTERIKVTKTDRGQIQTDDHFRVLDVPGDSVYAIGDCADIKNNPLPATAQVAERQGRHLAKLLNGKTNEAFKFRSMGMLAYIGGYSGLTDTPEAKLKGFPSWLLWRSAYFTRLGSWRLRMQVPIDWLKTLIYGRDTSRF